MMMMTTATLGLDEPVVYIGFAEKDYLFTITEKRINYFCSK